MTNHVENSQAFLIIQGIRHFTPVQERAFFALLRRDTGMDGRVMCLASSTPDLLRNTQKMIMSCTRSQLEAIATGHRDFTESNQRVELDPVDGYPLSGAQYRIGGWAAIGLTDKQISTVTATSAFTVRSHLKHAFSKLGVHNRQALAKFLRPVTKVGFHEAKLQPELLKFAELLYEGHTPEEIRDKLGVDDRTLKNMAAVAKRATGTPTIAALAAWYYQTQVRDVENNTAGAIPLPKSEPVAQR